MICNRAPRPRGAQVAYLTRVSPLVAPFLAASVVVLSVGPTRADSFPVPGIADPPLSYDCVHVGGAPVIDGRLNDHEWLRAPWTAEFTDIQGSLRPVPRFRTRAKMIWDDRYFYVAAEMEEPHLWATYDQRDMIIFHEHDFEVFIDPDGDTHEYYELEMNVLNTVWDLFLVKPYRDGGPALHAWDIAGLQTAVHASGTVNDPRDRDTGWTVEIAIPWSILAEAAHRASPPATGDIWRINFSRVEWTLDVVGGKYVKRTDPATGKPLPEDNWVWSPQGLIAMHYPERWGHVRFAGSDVEALPARERQDPGERALWLVYYQQKSLEARGLPFASRLADLPALEPDAIYGSLNSATVQLQTTGRRFEASLPSALHSHRLVIREDGKFERLPLEPKR